MFILFNAGQLGNQIFQYQFLEKLDPNEKIITSWCEYFDIIKYDKTKYTFVNKYVRFVFRRILKLLVKLRVVTYIRQDQDMLDGFKIDIDSVTTQKGLISFIKVVEGFFQAEKLVDNNVVIRDKYLLEAKEFLKDIPIDANKVFVHIRRGDYIDWSIMGKRNPALPVVYYENSIKLFVEKYENPYFIFLSNDSTFVEEKFRNIKNKKVSKNTVGVDLAIMTLCENGIISNSTLSWWGANLMKKKQKNLAPKYWLGWQSKTWFPKGIRMSCNVKYMNVEKSCGE